MTPLRIVRIGVWSLVLLLAAGTGFALWRGNTVPAGTVVSSGTAAIGGPFTLVDAEGRTVTEAIFAGRPHAVFFGFTHCPDVCPTTLAEMTVLMDRLGQPGETLTTAFVTVDPARDTPPVLKSYLSSFSNRILGLTGSEEQVADVVAKYRVYRAKVDNGGGDYTMDHTAAVFLFGADGQFRGTIAYGEPQDDALAKLQRLVAG